MIGNMFKSIRIKKRMKLKEIADITGIDLGHLSHIERGERNPSYKNIKLICDALKIPTTEFISKLDTKLEEEQELYGYVNYIPYNKVPLVDIIEYVDVPQNSNENVVAMIIKNDSMSTKYEKGCMIYVEMGKPIKNGDIGVFSYNSKILVRKFRYISNENIIKLEALNKNYPMITINEDDEFYIIGKVI